jgi:hypothetical protein
MLYLLRFLFTYQIFIPINVMDSNSKIYTIIPIKLSPFYGYIKTNINIKASITIKIEKLIMRPNKLLAKIKVIDSNNKELEGEKAVLAHGSYKDVLNIFKNHYLNKHIKINEIYQMKKGENNQPQFIKKIRLNKD